MSGNPAGTTRFPCACSGSRARAGTSGSPRQPQRLVRAAAFLLLAVVVPDVGAGAQEPDTLRMPPGWNDAYFKKLEDGRPRTAVVVMGFRCGEPIDEQLCSRMSARVVGAFVQAGRFRVVDPSGLPGVPPALTEPARAARVGEQLGAELVVFGVVTKASLQTIDKFAYELKRVEVAVDIRALSISTERWVMSETAEGSAEVRVVTTADGTIVSGPADFDGLYEAAAMAALDRAAGLVATSVPLIGSVIRAVDRDIVIDVGAGRGATPGDTFVIFRRAEELFHPVSHRHFGWDKTVLAVLEVTATEENLSTGRVVAVANRDVRIMPGDFVISQPTSGR